MPSTIELHIRRGAAGETTADLRAYRRGTTVLAPEQAVTLSTTALLALSNHPDVYGAALSAMVFPGPLREAWGRAKGQSEAEGVGVHLRVLIDDASGALHAIRWELLHDPLNNTALAQQEGGSLARTVPSDSLYDPDPPAKPRLRALVAVAGPSDGQQRFGLAPVDVASEAVRAREALGDIKADLLADTAPGASGLATLANIKDGLRGGAQLLYLVCHGQQTPQGTILYLVGDDGKVAPISGGDLEREIKNLGTNHLPLLAVLVACEGGSQEDAPLASVGPLLARAGVPAVIAMQAKISMAAAARLTARLLRELERDGRIDRALAAARKELGDEWWVPVLWLRARDGRLWKNDALSPNQGDRAKLRAIVRSHSDLIGAKLARFVGREAELADIDAHIAALQPTGGYLIVQGRAGQGKSSVLAARIARDLCAMTNQSTDTIRESQAFAALEGAAGLEQVPHHFIPYEPGREYQVNVLRDLNARLALRYNLTLFYADSTSLPALKDYFSAVLREIHARQEQMTIIIDGLDQIAPEADGRRDVTFLPPSLPPGIVIVIGTRPDDTLVELEKKTPCVPYELPDLSLADFARILARSRQALDDLLLRRFYESMQQNALYLDLAVRELIEQPNLRPEDLLARVAANPDNLFSFAIDRLSSAVYAQRWEHITRPILGLLLAAREPLSDVALRSLANLNSHARELRQSLHQLGGLLAQTGDGRYFLFHLKLRDYLREDLAQPRKDFVFTAADEQEYHQRLADWAEGGRGGLTVIWQDAPGDALEQERRHYARQHYIPHLAAARSYERLWAVIDAGDYGRAKLRYDPSGRSYVLDLDTVRDAVIVSAEGVAEQEVVILSQLWRYSLLRCSLVSRADSISDELFRLMAQLGKEQEAISLAEVLTDEKRKAEVLALIATELGKRQSPAGAQTLTRAHRLASDNQRPQERSDALVAVAKAAVTHGKENLASQIYDEALAAVQEIPYPLARVEALCAIAAAQREHDAACALATLNAASMTAKSITVAGSRADALRDVAAALTQAGAIDQASTLAHSIDNPDRRADALCKVAAALAQAGAIDQAITLAQSIDDPDRRADALCKIAAALAQAGAIDQAITLAQSIAVTGSRADALRDIATALTQVGIVDQATNLLTLAQTASQSIDDANRRVYALRNIAAALAQAGAIDQAITLAQSIDAPHPRADALGKVAVALAQAGAIDQAIALAQSIDDPNRRADAFGEVAAALAQAGAVDQAIALANSIDDSNRRADTLGEVAAALAQAGAIDRAITLAQSIDNTYSREKARYHIAAALTEAGAVDQAITLTQSIDNTDRRADALSEVAAALAQAGAIDQATTLAHSIDNTDRRADALGEVAAALAQAGAIDQAITLAQSIDDAFKRACALRKVAAALAQAGAMDQAITLVNFIDNPVQRAYALGKVATALAQAGAIDQAITLTQSIDDPGSQENALSSVAAALAQAGAIDQAITLAYSIANIYFRENALHSIAVALVQVGAVNQAIALAHSMHNTSSQVYTLSAVAAALAQAGIVDQATNLLTIAQTASQSIDDAKERMFAFRAIALALAQTSAFDQAITLAESIDNTDRRAYALGEVAAGLARTDAVDHAITLTHSIDNASARAFALSRIAATLAQAHSAHKLCALVRHAWRAADTSDYFFQLANLPQGQMIIEAGLDHSIPESIEWVQQFLQQQ